jgi:RNA polymerase-interacting CarD/CdnL/TRCF family regulator
MKGTFKKNVKAPLSKKLSKEQWAIARVYAFVMKTLNPREPQNQDKDLIKKARDILKKKKN